LSPESVRECTVEALASSEADLPRYASYGPQCGLP
jgi:hypothetical protein